MKVTKIISVGLCLCLLTGCADIFERADDRTEQPELQNEYVYSEYNKTQEGQLYVDYEVPVSVPKILINQVGYEPESNKVAVFRGENIPSVFEVLNEETDEVVYTGKIGDSTYNAELGEYNSYGTFSEVSTPGRYYLRADIIGMSYPFEIAEDIYFPIYQDAFRHYVDNDSNIETCAMCEELTILLLSFELYADTYSDNMDIPESGNGIPDILDAVKKSTEKLSERQSAGMRGIGAADGSTEEDVMASFYYAAVMAKFYTTYKLYDAVYADACLQSARKAFQFAYTAFSRSAGETAYPGATGLSYFGAAELYRATGEEKYAAVIAECCRVDNRTQITGASTYFYGDVTYLSTTYNVDTEICEALMNAMRDRVEKITGDSKREAYFTCANKEQNNNEDLLADMLELSVVNYIIANHEYDMVLQNHLHYFLGRNAQCVTYLPGRGYIYCTEDEALLNDAVQNARFLAMLSAIR